MCHSHCAWPPITLAAALGDVIGIPRIARVPAGW